MQPRLTFYPDRLPFSAGQEHAAWTPPLTIAAAINETLTVAVQVSRLLWQIRDSPQSVAAVLCEMDHIGIVFRALQSFVDRAKTVTRDRAALIQIEACIAILTQTVVVFSELETLLTPLMESRGWLGGIRRRLNWSRHERGVRRLVNQLQRHKTSLSLLLQVIQW